MTTDLVRRSPQVLPRCRTCLDDSSADFHSLHERLTENGKSLADLLLDTTRIEIQLDMEAASSLPSHICGNCAQQLQSAHSFILQAQRVNEQLLSLVNPKDSIKSMDCLSETPIDLPQPSSDYLQIKLETADYRDESVFNSAAELEQVPLADGKQSHVQKESMRIDTTTFTAYAYGGVESVQPLKEELHVNQDFETGSHSAAAVKEDPITVVGTNWDNTTDYLNDESDSAQHMERGIAKAAKKPRRRGRPRLAKNSSIAFGNDGRYICDVCGKTFAWKKDLHRHANTHGATPHHECVYCERRFLRKDKLKDHMKTHLKGKKSNSNPLPQSFAAQLYTKQRFRVIMCKLCDSEFKTTHTLRNHLLQVHNAPDALSALAPQHDVVKEFFPQQHDLSEVKAIICDDIAQRRLTKYYAVVNDFGYEMGLSDTDADSAAEEQQQQQQYDCEICHKTFTRKYQVITHGQEKHKRVSLPHSCTVCNIEFVNADIYKHHLDTQCRNKEKRYHCLQCPGRFMWLENLTAHQCLHHANDAAYAEEVPKKSDAAAEERTDLKQRHSDNRQQHRRSIRCYLCEQHFPKLHKLRAHLQLHADGVTGIDRTKGQFFKVQADAAADLELPLRIANDFAENKLSHYYSAVNESGNELDLHDSETDDSEPEAATQSPPQHTYTCEICAQCFQRRKLLQQHQYNEHANINPLPHACTYCAKQFVCEALLQQHLSRECLNADKSFECEQCAARFVWLENLLQHQQVKHSDAATQAAGRQPLVPKLQCEQCGKEFVWPKDLARHKRVHRPDDEKFACSFCDRKFNRKDNMQAHLKVHGVAAAASVIKKEMTRSKANKVKGIDKNLCKPHGCKLIQCMICLSKHTKIADLRTHLRTHQYAVNLSQRQQDIEEISQLLYPNEPEMSEQRLIARIIKDVKSQHQYERFYSITNEVGYELSISSSETDSDSELELDAEQDTRQSKERYTCEICNQHFARKYKIFEHQIRAHDWQDSPYACVHCNAKFLCKKLLKLHYDDQCKNNFKRFICRKCPLRFMWRDNLKMHLRTMHMELDDAKKLEAQRTFECVQCNRSFQMLKDLTRHMVMHREDVAEFKCLWCPRKFYRKENLHMHIARHGITAETLDTAECIVKATTTPHGTKQIYCKVCNSSYDSIAALRAHLRQEATAMELSTHHSYDSLRNYSITNSLGFELDIDDSESDSESLRQYTCDICKLTCKRKFEIAQHHRSVHKHEQLTLKCEKCVFRTVCENILSHHLRTQCNNVEKQYECPRCAFKFMWLENLQSHMKLLHDSEKNNESGLAVAVNEHSAAANAAATASASIFPCDKCNRKYTRKDRLTAHMKKVHSNAPATTTTTQAAMGEATAAAAGVAAKTKAAVEKKFLCAFCGRAVTSSSNLIIHMRRHTGEKPFKCEFCDMSFPRSSDLQCHRRTHTGEKPHKCTVCDKAFSRSYKLQTHMRIHSGERPYKCTYCEKSFTQSNDLTLHIRRHTGERPYVCGICGERFIQGTALKNHRTMRGHYEDTEPRRTTVLEQF